MGHRFAFPGHLACRGGQKLLILLVTAHPVLSTGLVSELVEMFLGAQIRGSGETVKTRAGERMRLPVQVESELFPHALHGPVCLQVTMLSLLEHPGAC